MRTATGSSSIKSPTDPPNNSIQQTVNAAADARVSPLLEYGKGVSMKHPISKIVLAGLLGGVTSNLAMLLTFRMLGFGWYGGGILLDASIQSSKLIAVWTQMEPLPRVVARPVPIILGFILFGIGHAFFYQWIAKTWPAGIIPRAWRMAVLIFFFSFLFWEFFTPYNLFGEPLSLIGLELVFWAIIAVMESLTIAIVFEWERKGRLLQR